MLLTDEKLMQKLLHVTCQTSVSTKQCFYRGVYFNEPFSFCIFEAQRFVSSALYYSVEQLLLILFNYINHNNHTDKYPVKATKSTEGREVRGRMRQIFKTLLPRHIMNFKLHRFQAKYLFSFS